jgi:hypothetical protein
VQRIDDELEVILHVTRVLRFFVDERWGKEEEN